MIGEAKLIDAPFHWFKSFQVQPVQFQWETEDSEGRGSPVQRRAEADRFQQCANGRSLVL